MIRGGCSSMWWAPVVLASTLGAVEIKPLSPGAPVADFNLRDHRGAERKLSDWGEQRLVVVAFLGVDCPLAKLYARRLNEIVQEFGPRGVAVIGINSNQHDQVRDIARFARAHEVAFPLLKDA